ncbi:MAG: helix-turn-helix domain-containing protein [Bifidobacterium longum]
MPQGLTGYSGHTFWPTSSSPPIQLEQEKRPLPQRNTSQNGHTFWPITPTAFIKGLTQADLSERTGLSRPWINQFEQGKIENASIGRILTLCNALGITLTVSYGTPRRQTKQPPVTHNFHYRCRAIRSCQELCDSGTGQRNAPAGTTL